jgi:TetR/AcrR family transcriptional repressor of nem operon
MTVTKRKGERTRQRIVEQAANVMSVRGYSATSMADLARETGLEKGSLYNHFDSKEALALAGQERAIDRLRAIVGVFRSLTDAPPLPGGDPVLNMAIESDDAYPALLERAQNAMTNWQKLIGKTARDGVLRGELRPDVNPRELASVVTSTLEGAVMQSKLFRDSTHMRWAVDHLMAYLDTLVLVEREGTDLSPIPSPARGGVPRQGRGGV